MSNITFSAFCRRYSINHLLAPMSLQYHQDRKIAPISFPLWGWSDFYHENSKSVSHMQNVPNTDLQDQICCFHLGNRYPGIFLAERQGQQGESKWNNIHLGLNFGKNKDWEVTYLYPSAVKRYLEERFQESFLFLLSFLLKVIRIYCTWRKFCQMTKGFFFKYLGMNTLIF